MRSIGNFFKALAKGTVFLFVRLHLWSPLVFFALYALICMLIGAKLSDGIPFLVLGLIMSAALSVWLSVRKKAVKRKLSYDEAKVNLSEVKLKDELKRGQVLGNNGAFAKNAIGNRDNKTEAKKAESINFNMTPNSNMNLNSVANEDKAINTAASGEKISPAMDKIMDDTYGEYKVFATKFDPTVFIYEYSDRLEFVKRTRQGMELMEVRYKERV